MSGFSRTRDQPLRWTEQMQVVAGTATGTRAFPVALSGERTDVPGVEGLPRPQFVLPSGGGLAYGGFTLDEASRAFLLEHTAGLADPVTRGAAWVTLWDEMLERRVTPGAYLDAALSALASETVEQDVQLLVGYVDMIFWRLLADPARAAAAPRVEGVLRSGLTRAPTSTLKATYFSGFRSTVTTPEGVALLDRVWRRQQKIPGLTLAEPDEATMALELAVRTVPDAQAILEEQRARFANPDRKARFEFVMPALSADPATRDRFFQSLRDADNRRREPWVIEGVRYLNHPLRAAASRKHLRPALDLLADIQRTGDIFFPKNWMDAVLSGHNTREAADIVRAFLDEKQDYPVRLRRVILQSADDLFRAAM